MTDRLSTLLHDEADRLVVPPAPAAAVLSRGRGLRARRRAGLTAGTSLAAAAAVGVVLVLGGGGGSRAVDPAGPNSGDGAVFAVGHTVYYDGGAHSAEIADKAIKSLYYTSAGLLVRHGNNNASDGGGPQRFSLVRPDGTVKPLSLVTEETVPGVDPAQPYVAWTEVVDGSVQVKVLDVRSDKVVADVDVPGAKHWGGWSGPPVALAGDTVYVGTYQATWTVDWRTGEVGTSDVVPVGYPSVSGGRVVSSDGKSAQVLDAATGWTLLDVDLAKDSYLQLSPDGRIATTQVGDHVDVIDVTTGEKVTVDGQSWDWGFTPDDDLFKVSATKVVTCDAHTGDCSTSEPHLSDADAQAFDDTLRIAGRTYES